MIKNWLIPCNVKYFDICEHFRHQNKVVWKNISYVNKGDLVYIYLGYPHKEIRYKCKVVDDHVSDEILTSNEYARTRHPKSKMYQIEEKYMELELIQELPVGSLTLDQLRANGLGQVQVQAPIKNGLREFIEEKCKYLTK